MDVQHVLVIVVKQFIYYQDLSQHVLSKGIDIYTNSVCVEKVICLIPIQTWPNN